MMWWGGGDVTLCAALSCVVGGGVRNRRSNPETCQEEHGHISCYHVDKCHDKSTKLE